MAGEPALVKLQDALVARLSTIAGVNVLDDRSDDEPVTPAERPAMVPRIMGADIESQLGGGEDIHAVEIEIDLYENGQTFNSISRDLAVMWSQVNDALATDRTLGGLVRDIGIVRYTVSPEQVPDVGCMTLTLATFLTTPADDWNTVMGASGPIS